MAAPTTRVTKQPIKKMNDSFIVLLLVQSGVELQAQGSTAPRRLRRAPARGPRGTKGRRRRLTIRQLQRGTGPLRSAIVRMKSALCWGFLPCADQDSSGALFRIWDQVFASSSPLRRKGSSGFVGTLGSGTGRERPIRPPRRGAARGPGSPMSQMQHDRVRRGPN
jgi:hypothetical protein